MKYQLIVIAIALFLETYGFTHILYDPYNWTRIYVYLCLHLISCSLLSVIILNNLPKRYKTNSLVTILFFFSILFSTPLLGGPGFLIGIVLALKIPRNKRLLPWLEFGTAELPYRPISISMNEILSRGDFRQVLQNSTDQEKKLKAIFAVNQMNKRDAITILRHSLVDPSDDVRLLAYACLDSYEKELSSEINKHQAELKICSGDKQINLKKLLAICYWEMTYLGLATGSIQTHFLTLAKKLLEEVLVHKRELDSLKLYGRILLALNLYHESTLPFYIALAKGIPRRQVLPYLAECYFLSRNFSKMRQILNEYKDHNPEIDAFTPVLSYWTK